MRVVDQVLNRLFNSAAEGRGGCSRYGSDVRGVASIEMALIFPMMLIIFVGLIDASNLMTANRRVTLTTSTLGDLVTQAPGEVWTTDMNGFFSAAQSIMDPFPADSIIMEFFTFRESGGSAVLDWTYSNSTQTCGAAPPADDPDMLKLMAENNDVVVSRVCYNWEPVLGIILGFTTSTIEDQIMLRPRQTARIVCNGC
ncbi:MAG TPA: TadE/TadG family type IV pilus assembly protein [Aestuariivirgaceae bacterium]|nr:TadE/TadG family type IV pilus assembly protein [Aestuariivirgaceae bacterium]